MRHKGYTGVMSVDAEAGVIRGKVVDLKDTITFQGKTVEEAQAAFRDSVDDYLEFCRELGEAPEKPFSGTFLVRLSPEVHRELNRVAMDRGVSFNRLVTTELTRIAGADSGQQFELAPVRKSAPASRGKFLPTRGGRKPSKRRESR
jgi:predicted HicB family RNase H-like nuclease